MDQETVLLIADEAGFARTLMACWQGERSVPAFTLVSSDLWKGGSAAAYDLAIVGPVRTGRLAAVLRDLDAAAAPSIHVAADAAALATLREQHPRIAFVRQQEHWAESVVLLGVEIFRRLEAQGQLSRSEQTAAASLRHATLGRYMLDMRHNFNNCLTSVLGNAELLLLEPGAFSAQIRDQISTIHSMALRMHEIMQRFSSIESEMRASEKESQLETKPPKQAVVSRV